MVGESHKEPITLQTLLDSIPASCQEIENYIQTNMKTFVLNGEGLYTIKLTFFRLEPPLTSCDQTKPPSIWV